MAVLLASAVTPPVDKADGGVCPEDLEQIDVEDQGGMPGTALLQQTFVKTPSTMFGALFERPHRAPHKKLPPFPTLAPEDAALLPTASRLDRQEQLFNQSYYQFGLKGSKSKGDWGVATVHLDAMSRPGSPDHLEDDSEEASLAQPSASKHKKRLNAAQLAETVRRASEKVWKPREKAGPKESLVARTVALKTFGEGRQGPGTIGATASLDDAGYIAVVNLRQPEDMHAFIKRAAQALGLKVTSDAGLQKYMHFLTGGDTQTYADLSADLLHTEKTDDSWLEKDPEAKAAMSGKLAPLDDSGYIAVATMKNHKEMKSFVQRVVRRLGLQVVNEGNLDGFVAYYSGEKATQDMNKLKKELQEIAGRKGQWIIGFGDEETETSKRPRIMPPR